MSTPLGEIAQISLGHIISSLEAHEEVFKAASMPDRPNPLYQVLNSALSPKQGQMGPFSPAQLMTELIGVFQSVSQKKTYPSQHEKEGPLKSLEESTFMLREAARGYPLEGLSTQEADLILGVNCAFYAISSLRSESLHHRTLAILWEKDPITAHVTNRPRQSNIPKSHHRAIGIVRYGR